VSVGDRVTLFGRDGEQEITLEEVAKHVGTIPYEIACSVGRRVERIYRGGDGVLAPKPRVESEKEPLAAEAKAANLART
jgi:alanine racemase